MSETEVYLWGRRIGAALMPAGSEVAAFEYEPEFVRSAIQVSPLRMPLREGVYSFPALSRRSFRGLPGLLADSLPDKFGNALIDTWLAAQGRPPESVNAVDRLCYIGTRGMGALQFRPPSGPDDAPPDDIRIDALVRLASEILTERDRFIASIEQGHEEDGLLEILSVGMSAGGARAKAVIAWNPQTNEIRSGQVDAPPGFDHWLLKFDGVDGNRDKEQFEDPEGFGAIEYAYSKMAGQAGIEMAECRLLEEGGRRHFMTRRFDRPKGNLRMHQQSLAALAHYDFNQAGAHSYEQAMMAIRQLGLSIEDVEQQFRRMAFNVIARNQDDHVKNIAFLMDKAGSWALSPAFDMTFAYKPDGDWTAQHQMTLNGKRDGFTISDFERCAESVSMKRGRAAAILGEVREAVAAWPEHAAAAGVDERDIERIGGTHRLELPQG